jgi:hypothetical protein
MNEHDYEEFKNTAPVPPPESLSTAIFARVEADLQPSRALVFAKLACLHFFTALITLAFCPQFGWGPLGQGIGLKELFMRLGPYGCQAACGSFFLGSTLAVASFVLGPDEVRCLRRNRWLELGGLSLLSLGLFLMIHPEIAVVFGLAWLAGALIGGIASLEFSHAIRARKILQN